MSGAIVMAGSDRLYPFHNQNIVGRSVFHCQVATYEGKGMMQMIELQG